MFNIKIIQLFIYQALRLDTIKYKKQRKLLFVP